jgi:hypothetical protein
MRALVLALTCPAALALPPVTQEEALAFHKAGLCQMEEPGQGLHRPDGDGYVVTSLPGVHRFFTTHPGGRVTVNRSRMGLADMAPGFGVPIHVEPAGAEVQWCVQFRPPGHDECGPVPKAFLYDARKVGDR